MFWLEMFKRHVLNARNIASVSLAAAAAIGSFVYANNEAVHQSFCEVAE